MIAKPLYHYQHWTCASPLYLSKHGRPKAINELQEHRCFHGLEQSIWKYKSGDVMVGGWLEINDNNMLKREALLGNAVIRVPQYFVEKEVKSGVLEKILSDEYLDNGGVIQMIYPQLIQQSTRLDAFIQFTMDWFKPH
jgi:DNA-binding transcriptional LysR family regulator